MGLVIGIDASRNRSGGAKRHLVGLLTGGDPRAHGISEVHVWSYGTLLDSLPDAAWLVRHSPRMLERSLLHQAWWQYRHLPGEARAAGCAIMLYTDAGTVGRFRPCVVMSRDMLTFEPGEMSRYRFSRAWLRLWLRHHAQARSMRAADGVVFLTEYAAGAIQRMTGPLGRVALIPHGVGEEFRNVGRTNGDLDDLPVPVRCLYVSNAELYKHQWHVVRAIAAMRRKGLDVALTLAGGGAGAAQERLDGEITRVDPDRTFVDAVGFVRPEHLPALLERADIFVFASNCENMPNTLVEGMAAGLPIACSQRGPMPSILDDGGVYFDPEDPDSIARAIEDLIVDNRSRRAKARRASEIARQFSWARCADETWSFLRSTAEAHGPAPARQTRRQSGDPSMKLSTSAARSYAICANCIMDTSDSGITFDGRGWCDYCNNYHRSILPNWHPDERGERNLRKIAQRIREEGKGKPFDCIMGISGGLDSSYATYIATQQMGLRPLLFHVDAGWNTDQAVGNIEKIVDGLGLDLYTEVIDWEEIKDLQVAFLKSQIPHQDIPQDTAFFATLYKFARANNLKYIITGGNFSTECCREPDEWGAYQGIDEKLILDIHGRFGTIPLKTFPIVDVFVYKVYYRYVHGMRVVKPLDMVPYVKKDAEDTLHRLFGWKRFQHKHHESRFTRFFEDYWLPHKFGFDRRRAHFSGLIMTGQMTRADALDRIRKPELDEHFLEQEFAYVANKLDLTAGQLRDIFNGPNRTIDDYRNRRRLIELSGRVMTSLGVDRRLYK